MQGKIYKARFFNKDSGVEITLDEAQSISETGKPIKILFHFIHSELMLIEGVVKGNTFTTLDGYSLLIKTEDNHLDLKNQDAELSINFCVGFKNFIDNDGIFQQEFYGFSPFFVKEYLDTIEDQKFSTYEFYVFFFSKLNVWCGLIHVASIEGNVITDTYGKTYKIVGSTKITCS